MVYGIVQGHRGIIELRTELGVGSDFIVTLPAAEPPVAAILRESRSLARGAGVHVLLVDDEDSFRRATERLLTQRGYRVTSVASGEEAVRAAHSEPDGFAMVLLDLVMPGMNGEQTFLALRTVPLEAPVLLMSGYDRGQRVQRILDQGAFGFVRKPFTSQALDEALSAACAQTPADNP